MAGLITDNELQREARRKVHEEEFKNSKIRQREFDVIGQQAIVSVCRQFGILGENETLPPKIYFATNKLTGDCCNWIFSLAWPKDKSNKKAANGQKYNELTNNEINSLSKSEREQAFKYLKGKFKNKASYDRATKLGQNGGLLVLWTNEWYEYLDNMILQTLLFGRGQIIMTCEQRALFSKIGKKIYWIHLLKAKVKEFLQKRETNLCCDRSMKHYTLELHKMVKDLFVNNIESFDELMDRLKTQKQKKNVKEKNEESKTKTKSKSKEQKGKIKKRKSEKGKEKEARDENESESENGNENENLQSFRIAVSNELSRLMNEEFKQYSMKFGLFNSNNLNVFLDDDYNLDSSEKISCDGNDTIASHGSSSRGSSHSHSVNSYQSDSWTHGSHQAHGSMQWLPFDDANNYTMTVTDNENMARMGVGSNNESSSQYMFTPYSQFSNGRQHCDNGMIATSAMLSLSKPQPNYMNGAMNGYGAIRGGEHNTSLSRFDAMAMNESNYNHSHNISMTQCYDDNNTTIATVLNGNTIPPSLTDMNGNSNNNYSYDYSYNSNMSSNMSSNGNSIINSNMNRNSNWGNRNRNGNDGCSVMYDTNPNFNVYNNDFANSNNNDNNNRVSMNNKNSEYITMSNNSQYCGSVAPQFPFFENSSLFGSFL